MPGKPWNNKKRKNDSSPTDTDPPATATGVADGAGAGSTSTGDRSVAAQTVHGGVHIGPRVVQSAPGVVPPADDVGVPGAGVHNLPRRPNPVFVGRDALLAEVAALFTPTDTSAQVNGARAAVGQAVTGLGGIGKSELALHYAAGRTGAGAVVWWADAETAGTLDLGLSDLAYRLQPKATAEEWTTAQAAGWGTGWLQAHTGWLLVLDNVEEPALVTPLLGKLTGGDVLITTRRDIAWPDHGVTALTLDLLSRPASVELLRERLQHASVGQRPRDAAAGPVSGFNADAAGALAAELGDLPLALQQAAGYITANRLPVATYLDRLRQHTGSMLAKIAPGAAPDRAVARVFTLTLKDLSRTAPAAVEVLRALGWVAPVPLPRPVIALTTDAPWDADPDGQDVDDLLGLLASYSLITLTTTSVTVHRLLQASLRDHDESTSDNREPAGPGLTSGQVTALGWLLTAVPKNLEDPAGWGLWRDLLPHLNTFFDRLPADPQSLDAARLLGLTGFYLWVQGRHQHALRLEQRALVITEAALGPDHPTTALRLDNLAATLSDLGRPGDALPLRRRALAITEAALGPDQAATATTLSNLAHTLGELGQLAEALLLQQRALTITEVVLGPDHPATATRLNNLAQTLADLGHPADALPLRRRALAITETALGPHHPTTALRLDNLAATLDELGRPADALPLQQRALTITEATLGPDHPDTAIRLDNLAGTLTDLGHHADALPLHQRALAITEATLGPDHPATAVRLSGLAYTLASLGRHADALPLRRRALAITEVALGPDHPTTASRLGNLGSTLTALGHHTDALDLQQRALTITEATLGPDHPDTATRMNNLAFVFMELDRAADALPLQHRALAITEATLGPDHPNAAIQMNNLAHILDRLGRAAEAAVVRERISAAPFPEEDDSRPEAEAR
ncbi:FxSxx-COOH system tetratricopeptide repeat protein [Acidothermaceae bacterium B102]|nr:FxSxx-COOH system tetratricopeptide repeat protein [Acidothermaceae bacterium B102]